MQRVDQLLSARWVIPVQPRGLVLDDHCVVVDGDTIVDIMPSRDAVRLYEADTVIELPEHALIPGLINAHTHAAMTLLRGYADDLPLTIWLQDHIWPTESAWVSPDFVADGTALAISEMLTGGVTCFSDMYFFPEVAADMAMSFGMRMVAGLVVFDNPTNYSRNADECISKGLALYENLRDSELVTTAFAPHAPYTVGDHAFSQIADLSARLNIPVHTHINETGQEAVDSVEHYGLSQLRRLSALGVLNDRLVGAHMVHPSDDDVELLQSRGCHVVHCPESNMKLANGFAPVARLIDADINVAIGTDGAASNNDLDMLAETRIAALLAKGSAGDAAALPADQALYCATMGGATALGLADLIGSITTGKRADLTAIRLNEWANQPLYDPVSQIVYTANRNQVTDVWVNGRQRVSDGELQGVDTDQVRTRAAAWATRISAD